MNILLRPKAVRFIRKADKQLTAKIKAELRSLAVDPLQNPELKTPLKPLRSHHFVHCKTQYRIAYLVEDGVVIIVIGTRENFYRGL